MLRGLVALLSLAAGQAAPGRIFQNTLPLDQMTGKQAVVETTRGDVRHPAAAGGRAQPRRLLHEAGARRRVRRDDLPSRHALRDHPGRRSAVEGSGEGGAVRHGRPERAAARRLSSEKHTAGAVSAVLAPGKPDSARRAVLRVRHRSARARRPVHRVRPGRRRASRSCSRFRRPTPTPTGIRRRAS